MKTMFISMLGMDIQGMIRQDLINEGLDTEDIDNAMSSRLIDLQDTIDITPYL